MKWFPLRTEVQKDFLQYSAQYKMYLTVRANGKTNLLVHQLNEDMRRIQKEKDSSKAYIFTKPRVMGEEIYQRIFGTSMKHSTGQILDIKHCMEVGVFNTTQQMRGLRSADFLYVDESIADVFDNWITFQMLSDNIRLFGDIGALAKDPSILHKFDYTDSMITIDT